MQANEERTSFGPLISDLNVQSTAKTLNLQKEIKKTK